MTPVVRVLIADDDPLFMDALEAILGIEAQIEIAGRAHDGEEAMRLAGELEPDVVLLDLSMPVVDGFEASRRIRAEALPPRSSSSPAPRMPRTWRRPTTPVRPAT
jgi:DNA-binding NarL/FixJ family response regulator